jgi:hypothetical protein
MFSSETDRLDRDNIKRGWPGLSVFLFRNSERRKINCLSTILTDFFLCAICVKCSRANVRKWLHLLPISGASSCALFYSLLCLAALKEKALLFSSQINFFASVFSFSQSREAVVFLYKTQRRYSDVICAGSECGKQQIAAARANSQPHLTPSPHTQTNSRHHFRNVNTF